MQYGRDGLNQQRAYVLRDTSEAAANNVRHETRGAAEPLKPRSSHWHESLAYRVTPKSGPLGAMETLLDANRAISSRCLPVGSLKTEHWRKAGWALV